MTEATIPIFLDRSVGSIKIAAALRALDLDVETIQDRYGTEAPRIADTQWIEDATLDGRILIGADKRIRHRSLERLAICRYEAKCFTFPTGNLTANEMIARLKADLAAIMRLSREAGPFVYHLTPQGPTRMALDCADL
ncbi:hypothetical protein [Actinoplanes sp. NPDC051859]|uniref:PIN-like domain-containing protein n=1 Tax=Actinoplanes sp. NPDC051859 TaxID=3363909 RepID=UPI0037B6FB21